MSSAPPPRTLEESRKLRPWFLVAAMILAWFVGAHGASSGCTTVAILHDGVIPDQASLAAAVGGATEPAQALAVAREAAILQAMARWQSTAFPLGVARLLLGSVLVVASAMAMVGRPGARAFAMQAVLAHAALGAIEFVLSRPIRDAWVPEVTAAAREILAQTAGRELFGGEDPGSFAIPVADASFWYWRERLRLGIFDLGTMALAFAALATTRSKAFFDATATAAAAMERQRGEDDEP